MSAPARPTCSGYYAAAPRRVRHGVLGRGGVLHQAAAQAAAAEVASGTPFAQVATKATQRRTADVRHCCRTSPPSCRRAPTSRPSRPGSVSAPIDRQRERTTSCSSRRGRRRATPRPRRSVARRCRRRGPKATQKAITAAERHASVSVDPRYGVWVPVTASVLHAVHARARSDVLNASANEAGVGSAPARPRPPARPAAEGGRGAAPTSRWWASGPPARTSSATAPPRCSQGRVAPTCGRPATPRRRASQGALLRRPLRVRRDLRRGVRRHRRGAGGGRAATRRPSRSSTPCPGRRWWPSAASSCCAPTGGSRSRSCRRSPSSTWPGPRSASTRWREGVRLVDAAAFGSVAAHERGPFLVAQCWSRHLLSEVKLGVARRGGRATLPRARDPAPPRARRRGGGRRRLVGARPDAWSPTT